MTRLKNLDDTDMVKLWRLLDILLTLKVITYGTYNESWGIAEDRNFPEWDNM